MWLKILEVLKVITLYFVISISVFLMFRLVLMYVSFDTNIGFLSLKQESIKNPIWLCSFYIHVFSSSFCLLAGFTQFSKTLLLDHPKIHRYMGKAYVFNILVVNFPVAMVMAFYANGLWPSKMAFTLLDLLWFWFTLQALLKIKNGDVIAHKQFMIRSFALTFSAITLRTWEIVLVSFTDLDLPTIYMIDAWLGFVPNLLIAEWLIYKKLV